MTYHHINITVCRYPENLKKENMKKTTLLTLFALPLLSFVQSDEPQVISKEEGMTVVNTATLGRQVTGYVGATPLKIYVKKNKVVKIEALKNQETPKYMARVKKELLDKWNGKKVTEASQMQVDGVTGATFTSEAIKQNVKLGLDYYLQHK